MAIALFDEIAIASGVLLIHIYEIIQMITPVSSVQQIKMWECEDRGARMYL